VTKRLPNERLVRRGFVFLPLAALVLTASLLALAFEGTFAGTTATPSEMLATVTTSAAPSGTHPYASADAWLPTPAVRSIVTQIASVIEAGVARSAIGREAGQRLLVQLEPLSRSAPSGPPGAMSVQFDRLVAAFYGDLADGQIRGMATIKDLASPLGTLAVALLTTMPFPSGTQAVPKRPSVDPSSRRGVQEPRLVAGGRHATDAGGTAAGQVPATIQTVPTTRPPVPTTRPPVPTTRPPVPTTRPPVPTTRPPVPTTRPPVPTTRPPVPTTRPPVPTTGAKSVKRADRIGMNTKSVPPREGSGLAERRSVKRAVTVKRTTADPRTVPSSTTSEGPTTMSKRTVVARAKTVTKGTIAPNRIRAVTGTNGIANQRTLCIDVSGNFVPCSLTTPSALQPGPTTPR
jgi:hypothetical protein